MRARFRYKTILINEDWTGERLYEAERKLAKIEKIVDII